MVAQWYSPHIAHRIAHLFNENVTYELRWLLHLFRFIAHAAADTVVVYIEYLRILYIDREKYSQLRINKIKKKHVSMIIIM